MSEDRNLVKQVHTVITSAIDALIEVTGDSNIDQGTAFDWLLKSGKEYHDRIKAHLRMVGLTQLDTNNKQAVLSGKLGQVTVTFTDSKPCLKKGVDIESLKSLLGDDFNRFFDTKVTFQPGPLYEESYTAVKDHSMKSRVASNIEYKANEARVSFPKG